MVEDLKLAVLYSNGKDSCYSTLLSLLSGKEIKCLITLIPAEDSLMFHNPFTDKIEEIKKFLPFPIIIKKCTNENELSVLKEVIAECIEKFQINGIVTGAINSDYQRMRINFVCEELNLPVFSFLWKKPYKTILEEEVSWLKFVIVKIMCEGLKKDLIGKIITKEDLKELLFQKMFNPVFEGGEAETFTLYAPFFEKEIKIKNKRVLEIDRYIYSLDGELE
ncbi:MAG: diphthine--ammonia ligase [Candidatus Woesearchaeota archaeon]